jgi:hypothetical protein
MISFEDSIFNSEVQQWTINLLAHLRDELDSLGVQHYPYSPNPVPLRSALKARYYKNHGAINAVGILMPSSAVFLHKGVGKNHPKENPRTAKPFFNPPLERNLSELYDIVGRHHLDFIAEKIFIH